MIGSFLETVTRRRVVRDRHGDPVGAPEDVDVDVAIEPRFAGNRTDDSEGDVAVVDLTLYAEFGADIVSSDQVVIVGSAWGGTYDVVGEPAAWKNPQTGVRAGLEVHLTRTG